MSASEPTDSGQRPAPLDSQTALAIVALIVGAGFVLVRADAAAGYGPFAPVIAAVVWLVAWTLAALGSGRPLVRSLAGPPDGGWGNEVLAAVAGAAVLIASAAVLSVAGLFRPWPLLAVVLLWAAVGALDLFRRPLPRPIVDLRVGPLIGLAGVAALIATAVSPFYDQWHQHLGFPWVWLRGGSIHALPHDWYSFMPVNSSLLFAYGLKTLGPWSAQIVHWWCGVVTVLAIGCLAMRSGKGGADVWAVWIFATTPVVLHLATTAGSDLVVSMFAAGAWIALMRTVDDGHRSLRWWLVAGACVGLAAGTKYIAFGTVAAPVVAGALVLHRPWRVGGSGRRFVRSSALASAMAAAVFSPWAIRNFVATGNPLFPFANRVFAPTLRQPFDSAGGFSTTLSGLDASFRHLVSGLDLRSFSASIDGFPSIGFVYIALVAMVALMWPRLRRAPGVSSLSAGALVGIGFWLVTMHVSRYLVPVLVPAAAVLGASMAAIMHRLPTRLRAGVAAVVGLVFALNLSASVTPIGVRRLGSTLGVTPIEPLLARWVSSTPSFDAVRSLDDDARVLMVAEARALGFERSVEFSDPYRDPLLLDLVRDSQGTADLTQRLEAIGVTHVLANRWEAVRCARLRGNDRFFVVEDPAVAHRLDDFCARCLEPTWSGSGLFLYRLVPECDVAAPGGASLATW